MTPIPEPEDDAPIPPAWWLASARKRGDDRHAGPNAEQGEEDAEPRAFIAPAQPPGVRR